MYFVKRFYLAFGVPAAGADEAALLIDEEVAAVRTLPGQVFSQSIVFQLGLIITTANMFFQNAGNGVSAGENRFALFPGDGWATDTTELPHH